jgi:hypothetical protein
MMRRSTYLLTLLASVIAIAACGRAEEDPQPSYETIDPSATEPAATTAPPAEMQPDTIGADTLGGGPET